MGADAGGYPRSHVEMIDPSAMEITPVDDAPNVERAVKLALLKRGWLVDEETPGRIQATLTEKEFRARIAVTFDARNVEIRYVSSEGLQYEDRKGRRYVHANYNRWIQNLGREISYQFTMLSAG
ncbi:MAG TPA: hypothetical protein VM240_01865 [Verrucomicrobiae bacterium]|nr:hypothetical protein [Verrucomicrobiae bacterium]